MEYFSNICSIYRWYCYPLMMMLNEWVFDARLMEQQVTRLFILLRTDTIFIDRPTDPSLLETLWLLSCMHRSSHPRFICLSSTVCPSSSIRRPLRLRVLCVPVCSVCLRHPLWERRPISGLSANPYISLFGSDKSCRLPRQGLSQGVAIYPLSWIQLSKHTPLLAASFPYLINIYRYIYPYFTNICRYWRFLSLIYNAIDATERL